MKADFVRVEHSVDRPKMSEWPVVYRCLPGAGGNAHAYRALAIELAMRTAADLPEFFNATGGDIVVGASQASIGAEAHERCQHLRWRVAAASVKAQSQQGGLATPAVAAATAARFVLCLVHLQRAATEILAVETLHGLGRIAAGHLDKSEASGASCLAIVYQRDRLDGAVFGEQRTQRVFARRERKISDIEFGHGISWMTMSEIARRYAWSVRES